MERFFRGIKLSLCCLALSGSPCRAQDYPHAEISNQSIKAILYVPDAQKGYYRATRFDWAGVIKSLQFDGHEYFGPRLSHPDPFIHNSTAGPVECFEADLGFADAKPGGRFIRIGVGILEKPIAPDFQPTFDHTYKLLDSGKRRITRGENWIEFVQEIPDEDGYSYVYTKRLQLTLGRDEMIIFHTLSNTGSRVIETTQYNHNYFMIDHQPSGEGFAFRVPFVPRIALLQGPEGLVAANGNEIIITKKPPGDELALLEVSGYGLSAKDYDISLENRNTGAGVRITADRPFAKLRIVVADRIAAPEPFIQLSVPPGGTEKWETVYTFYTQNPVSRQTPASR